MQNQIFPTSITKFSTESLIKKHTTKSKAIYWLLILVVVVFGVSIFYIKVDVNIYSRGIITSEQQTTQLVAPIFGKVIFVKLKENSFVNKLLKICALCLYQSVVCHLTSRNRTLLLYVFTYKLIFYQ